MKRLGNSQNMLIESWTKENIEAGVDEVGRGCIAGPVVAAAVILPKKVYIPGLRDSKKMSLEQREEVEVLIKQVAVDFAIGQVSNTDIDRINILQATFQAMHQALDGLKCKPDLILVDGNRFRPYPFVSHLCKVKGDSVFASIAAASVLAKCYRDRWMKEKALMHPEYGWDTNVGYLSSKHLHAIRQFGYTDLHRRTFVIRQLASESKT